jgi:hypothetical protein
MNEISINQILMLDILAILISTSNSHSDGEVCSCVRQADQPGVGRVKKCPSGVPHHLPPSPGSTKFTLKISMPVQEHLPLNRASHIDQWARDLPEKFKVDQRDLTDVLLEAKPEWSIRRVSVKVMKDGKQLLTFMSSLE